MRNTVWGFGDSYITLVPIKGPPFHPTWAQIVANDLDMDLQEFGVSGSSLEYIAHTYTEEFRKIKSGDVVLITITSLTSRKWLVEDQLRMQTSKQVNRMAEDGVITEKDRDFYLRVIAEEVCKTKESLLKLLLHSLHSLIAKGVKVIVLPNFNHPAALLKDYSDLFPLLPTTEGDLMEHVTFLEVKGIGEDKRYVMQNDPRRNHMTYDNHIVLAEKVLAVIKGKTSKIDLTQGFHADILESNRPC